MRYDNQSPVVALEGLLEHVLGTDIHVVGRLVEGQQVVRVEYELGHGKTGTLASAEYGHLLVDVLTAEEKGPEDIPQPCADIAHSHLVEGIVDRIVFIEDVLLVLGIVAESHIVPERGRAGYGPQLPGDIFHHGTLTFSVAADEGHLLPSLHRQVDVREDHLRTAGAVTGRITSGEGLGLKDDLSRAGSRRELDMQGRIVLLVYLYPLELVESLYAGLNLIALGGLVSETLDELLCLLYHPLLVLVGGPLLFHPLAAQLHIFRIRHLVVVDVTEDNLHRSGCHPVQETAVVRDEHHRAPVAI